MLVQEDNKLLTKEHKREYNRRYRQKIKSQCMMCLTTRRIINVESEGVSTVSGNEIETTIPLTKVDQLGEPTNDVRNEAQSTPMYYEVQTSDDHPYHDPKTPIPLVGHN